VGEHTYIVEYLTFDVTSLCVPLLVLGHLRMECQWIALNGDLDSNSSVPFMKHVVMATSTITGWSAELSIRKAVTVQFQTLGCFAVAWSPRLAVQGSH
jgi:hypothetical protein